MGIRIQSAQLGKLIATAKTNRVWVLCVAAFLIAGAGLLAYIIRLDNLKEMGPVELDVQVEGAGTRNALNDVYRNTSDPREIILEAEKLLAETDGAQQDTARIAIIDQCIVLKDIPCIESHITQFNNPDQGLINLYKEKMAEISIEQGDTETAKQIYQGLLAEAAELKAEGEIDPVTYYQEKLEALE